MWARHAALTQRGTWVISSGCARQLFGRCADTIDNEELCSAAMPVAPRITVSLGGRRAAATQLERAVHERRDVTVRRIERMLAKSPASRQRVVAAMLDDVAATRGWSRMNSVQRGRVEAMLSGVHNASAPAARVAYAKLLHSREFKAARSDKQQRLLEQHTTTPTSLPPAVPPYLLSPNAGALRVERVREEKYMAFHNSMEPGVELMLRVSGDPIKLRVAKSIGRVQVERVLTALTLLPPIARPHVRTIVMEPERSGLDRAFAQMFDMPRFRSAMTADGDTVRIYPREELWRPGVLTMLLLHEAGHNWSFTQLGPQGHRAWERWAKVMQADGLAPSQYAKKTRYEDFAETFALYFGTRGTPAHDEYRRLFPKRFGFIDRWVVEASR